MRGQDQSLEKPKIQAEDVAYAAFHDTLFDVEEELMKYDNAVLSGDKLQTPLVELDVPKNSIDTSYNTLLDAAISPLSSRLRRRKANLETRIAEMKNLLTSNAAQFTTEQRELCGISDESQIIVAATENDEDDSIQIDDAVVQSYNTPLLLLSVIILLTVVIDSKQLCSMKPDPIDDLIVEPDEDLQKEQYPVPGFITEQTLNTDMNMTVTCVVDCSAAEAYDHICKSRVTNGLKHRWRWKQYEFLYRTDPDTDLRTVL